MKISNTYSGLVLFIPGLLQYASAAGGREAVAVNLNELCPNGQTAEDLPAHSPWQEWDHAHSCTGDGDGTFVKNYKHKHCSGDESSVVIYLDGGRTGSTLRKCMAAWTRCNINMDHFEQLDLDMVMRDCENVWIAPIWQMPNWQTTWNKDYYEYNQGMTGEYDYYESSGVNPRVGTNAGDGHWRAPGQPPSDVNNRGSHNKIWNESQYNPKHVNMHMTVQKQANGHIRVQYCDHGSPACTITNDSADYGMDIQHSEMYTGTVRQPVDAALKGLFDLRTDIWNVNSPMCGGTKAEENCSCRYSLTNVRVKGGLENGQCSKINASFGPQPPPTPAPPSPGPSPGPTPDPALDDDNYVGNCLGWCEGDIENGTNPISRHCGASDKSNMWKSCGGCHYCPNCTWWCKADQEGGTNPISKHCSDPSMIQLCGGCQYCFHKPSPAPSSSLRMEL